MKAVEKLPWLGVFLYQSLSLKAVHGLWKNPKNFFAPPVRGCRTNRSVIPNESGNPVAEGVMLHAVAESIRLELYNHPVRFAATPPSVGELGELCSATPS